MNIRDTLNAALASRRDSKPRRISNRDFAELTPSLREAIVKAEDDILMERFDEWYPCTGVNGYCGDTGEPRPDSTPPRFWFAKPSAYIGRLSPVWLGGDEWCRRTLVIGWSVTGQIIIAMHVPKDCR